MTSLDWAIVGAYCVAMVAIGVWLSKKGSRGIEDYFVAGRSLPWWLAGTSMVATTFASDTPLLVTGLVRSKGVWANWSIWGLLGAHALMFALFARLWRRTGVVTEVQFVETRYSGPSAAALRGFKALFWGFLFNCYIAGAWPVLGLVKVMSICTDWSKTTSVLFSVGVTVAYCTFSGYWGVVATDLVQFALAMIGAVVMAVCAFSYTHGFAGVPVENTTILPPAGPAFSVFLGYVLIQWWAFKSTDGGGPFVQRLISCKNEREAERASLWFLISHYAIRSWPWIVVALCSLAVFPKGTLGDDEAAYPLLMKTILPSIQKGLLGLLIASFFAAFMSTMDTHMNWGASYVVNDFYKRFVVRGASDAHYVRAAWAASLLMAAGAAGVAFLSKSIWDAFDFVLSFTAGIGVVNLARWLWWRVNAWSEIGVMAASMPAILIAKALKLQGPLEQLPFIVAATALVWVPLTLATAPVDRARLVEFFRRVRPVGFWGPVAAVAGPVEREPVAGVAARWACAVVLVLGLLLGIGQAIFGNVGTAAAWIAAALAAGALLRAGRSGRLERV